MPTEHRLVREEEDGQYAISRSLAMPQPRRPHQESTSSPLLRTDFDPPSSSFTSVSSARKASSSVSGGRRRAVEGEPPPSYLPSLSNNKHNTPRRSSSSTKAYSEAGLGTGAPTSRVISSGSSYLSGHPGRVTVDHLFQTSSSSNNNNNISHLESSSHKPPRSSRARSRRSAVSERMPSHASPGVGDGGDYDSASESGASIVSSFRRDGERSTSTSMDRHKSSRRRQTDSPLRRGVSWMVKSGKARWSLLIALALIIWVKWTISLASYSGMREPPIRGDLEAQRHWIALTSSSVASPLLFPTSSNLSIPLSQWYSHDTSYWGLDYPPLTAYHSLLLGVIARLSPHSAAFVELRPPTTSSEKEIAAWEGRMTEMEQRGEMKHWLRGTVIAGDLVVWISAVVYYARANFNLGRRERATQTVVVATLSILLQPALILIDHGHFQYNSIMLGLALWSVNFFQSNHDLLGAVAFVLSLGFKQMALYYSPAIFAYLLGKCLYIGGREGISLLFNLAFVTLATFALVFSPFLYPPSLLLQSLHRIFPFARGLFEDKVANFWCALNIVIKLRDVASVPTLAKLALLATLIAIIPGVAGLLWVSHEAGRRRRANESSQRLEDEAESTSTPPTLTLLPHALFVSSMAFFLFSFQVHEKSILLPLMPLTLRMGGREAGFARMDWEWAVLMNNVAVFSMWPLLKREGLGLQYLLLTLFWNFLIGYNPFELRRSFVKYLSLTAYGGILVLHLLELIASPPAHLPDLFVVFNLTLSAGVFGLAFLWATKRSVQEGWAVVGVVGFEAMASRDGSVRAGSSTAEPMARKDRTASVGRSSVNGSARGTTRTEKRQHESASSNASLRHRASAPAFSAK